MIKLILIVFSLAFVVVYKGDPGLWTRERSQTKIHATQIRLSCLIKEALG